MGKGGELRVFTPRILWQHWSSPEATPLPHLSQGRGDLLEVASPLPGSRAGCPKSGPRACSKCRLSRLTQYLEIQGLHFNESPMEGALSQVTPLVPNPSLEHWDLLSGASLKTFIRAQHTRCCWWQLGALGIGQHTPKRGVWHLVRKDPS